MEKPEVVTPAACMLAAIEQADLCQSENIRDPKVGAVVELNGRIVNRAYRGELDPRDHAEYTLLESKLESTSLIGSTVYTTLEPCTSRGPGKVPCADRLVERQVGQVVIGMLDPNRAILGQGVERLQNAGIAVQLFDPRLVARIKEQNRVFIRDQRAAAAAAELESRLSAITIDVNLDVENVDAATGVRITRPTRIQPGSKISIRAKNTGQVIGLSIGGRDDD